MPSQASQRWPPQLRGNRHVYCEGFQTETAEQLASPEHIMTNPMHLRAVRAAIGCIACLVTASCSSAMCEEGTACSASTASASSSLESEFDGSETGTQPAPATATDMRPGFVSCGADGQAVSCGEGQGCCAGPIPMCGTWDSCLDANGGNPMLATFNECDGPEDCETGEECWQGKGGTVCAAQGGYAMMCHADSDCPAEQPVCSPAGTCAASEEVAELL